MSTAKAGAGIHQPRWREEHRKSGKIDWNAHASAVESAQLYQERSAVGKPTICKFEMGNKKNKNNSRNSTHRHVFCKKVLPGMKKTPKKSSIECSGDKVGNQKECSGITFEGSRIINLDRLQEYTDSLSKHSSSCQGSIILTGETRHGLASILTGQCNVCKHSIKLETSNKVKGPQGYSR